jgi:hypothetical protein
MGTRAHVRRRPADLLERAPSEIAGADHRWSALVVDPVAQLGELADLTSRGLLSAEEYDRFKARILKRDPGQRPP